MITQKEILRLARERDACEQGLAWYSQRPKSALLTWEALEKGYFLWVAENVPEAIPYLQTLPEELKEKSLRSPKYFIRLSMACIGYRLDVLKDDPYHEVRREVSKHGYALEQLKDDPHEYVRKAARDTLKEMKQ